MANEKPKSEFRKWFDLASKNFPFQKKGSLKTIIDDLTDVYGATEGECVEVMKSICRERSEMPPQYDWIQALKNHRRNRPDKCGNCMYGWVPGKGRIWVEPRWIETAAMVPCGCDLGKQRRRELGSHG